MQKFELNSRFSLSLRSMHAYTLALKDLALLAKTKTPQSPH